LESAPNPTEDPKSSKNSPAAGSSVHLPQNEIGLTMLLHYWESAPNPTEDRKSSK
jgi:hypothetical protein